MNKNTLKLRGVRHLYQRVMLPGSVLNKICIFSHCAVLITDYSLRVIMVIQNVEPHGYARQFVEFGEILLAVALFVIVIRFALPIDVNQAVAAAQQEHHFFVGYFAVLPRY